MSEEKDPQVDFIYSVSTFATYYGVSARRIRVLCCGCSFIRKRKDGSHALVKRLPVIQSGTHWIRLPDGMIMLSDAAFSVLDARGTGTKL